MTAKKVCRMVPGMKTPSDIIDLIGADRVKAAVGVEDRRIRQARLDDTLPASWYDALERLAGRDLPRSLFSFKGLDE